MIVLASVYTMSLHKVFSPCSGAVGSIATALLQGPRFNVGCCLFVQSLAYSSCVCVGFLWVLRVPLTSQKDVSSTKISSEWECVCERVSALHGALKWIDVS